jgi:hypothetical protein
VDKGELCGGMARIIASPPSEQMQEYLAERVVKNMNLMQWKKAAAVMWSSKRQVNTRFKRFKFCPLTLSAPGDWTSAKLVETLGQFIKKMQMSDVSSVTS